MDLVVQNINKLSSHGTVNGASSSSNSSLVRWNPRHAEAGKLGRAAAAPELPLFCNPSSTLDAVIISDIHLGCENCQAKLLTTFLEGMLSGRLKSKRLIINGDVFDSIDFRRLKKTHWKVLSMIRHLSDKIEVVWTCGNHDGPADIFSHLLGVQVHDDYIFNSGQKRILVMHGHVFDDFIDEHPFVTWLGDTLYNLLQKVDRRHHVARLAKSRSKIFLHCVEKVQNKSIAQANRRHCNTVICGHTHHATAVHNQGVDYFNSGCWTELPATWLAVKSGVVRLCKFHMANPAVQTASQRSAVAATAVE
jgi:UDP-2,3-diacylglucosamine pyrophosphatase LpxH